VNGVRGRKVWHSEGLEVLRAEGLGEVLRGRKGERKVLQGKRKVTLRGWKVLHEGLSEGPASRRSY
jgi:hypothetical protein